MKNYRKGRKYELEVEELRDEIAGYVAANGIMTWSVPEMAKWLVKEGWTRQGNNESFKAND